MSAFTDRIYRGWLRGQGRTEPVVTPTWRPDPRLGVVRPAPVDLLKPAKLAPRPQGGSRG